MGNIDPQTPVSGLNYKRKHTQNEADDTVQNIPGQFPYALTFPLNDSPLECLTDMNA